ncbi:MAG: hypothetical protein ACYC64_02570 [Armatimonadota bacterium]
MRKFTGRTYVISICVTVLLAAVLACGGLSMTYAATGSIYATPQHLVLDRGTLGSSTITWSTSGCPTAQVYVSMDGGAQSLMAAGVSGSSTPNWIQPEKVYVFYLYEGTAHTNLLAWTSVTSHCGPASRMGFNYWPETYGDLCLKDANWTTMRPIVAADLDAISALSGDVIRIMFWPGVGRGWELSPTPHFTTVLDEMRANLPDFLSLCYDRKIRVEVAFGNTFFGVGTGGLRWWDIGYSGDWSAFCADAVSWVNGTVQACENSAYKSTVISYEYEQEMNNTVPSHYTYLNYLYDNCTAVPRGKRLESPVLADFADDLASNLGSRRIDYIDFHTYDLEGSTQDPEVCYDAMHGYFPHSTVGCGEYGHITPDSSEENAQETRCFLVADSCVSNGVHAYNNWEIWDTEPHANDCGWGYDKNTPKDIIGSMASDKSLLSNADMEILGTGGKPADWSSAGVTNTFTRYTPGITNSYCGRLTVTSPTTGNAWIASKVMNVNGSETLFANAYIKSNMTNIKIGITEYDANSTVLRQTSWPTYSPANTNSFSYIHAVGSRYLALLSTTRKVVMTLQGTTSSSTRYMDVDAFSVWARE